MNVSRNDPCPCGSGKKYKKCCLEQDEKTAVEQRRQQRLAEDSAQAALIEQVSQLTDLSNQANDLICDGQWTAAYEACRLLLERFPEETDGDERFSAYYKRRGDFAQAKLHAQSALKKAQSRPEKFDAELIRDLNEEISCLDQCLQADRQIDR